MLLLKHNKLIAFGIILSVIILLCGCSQSLTVPTESEIEHNSYAEIPYDEEYYATNNPSEYLYFINQLFVSLLPSIDKKAEFDSYHEILIGSEERKDLDYNTICGTGSAYVYRESIPVFYGLLKETEKYLEDHQINRIDGDYRYINVSDIQCVTDLLLKKKVSLSFQSVAGAVFDEDTQRFTYKSLEDPFQEYRNNGWTLEFASSNLRLSQDRVWGEGMTPVCEATMCFWYDPLSFYLYNMDGEKIGYTHNIEGLRDGESLLSCCFSTNPFQIQTDFVSASFSYSQKTTSNSPIEKIEIGTTILSAEGSYSAMDTFVSPYELEEIGRTFFTDFYHTDDKNEIIKVSPNYFLASYYKSPNEIDISRLPLTNDKEADMLLEEYLGIGIEDVDMDISKLGANAYQDIPYVCLSFGFGNRKNDIIEIRYYNEMLQSYAVLTIKEKAEGYVILSNLPYENKE